MFVPRNGSCLAYRVVIAIFLNSVYMCQYTVLVFFFLAYCTLYNRLQFRKMVTITLHVRQQKRHRCIEQSFVLCGRGWGWDDLGEWHWNMYNITCEMNHQSSAGALGWPRGMVRGGRWERGSGWGTREHEPMADSCWCMAKPIQYCKVISLQLK